MADKRLVVRIAEMQVLVGSGEIVTYALGSCVGVCFYDGIKQVAGMVHIMLPSRLNTGDNSSPCKYSDSGCQALMDGMIRAGALKGRIAAKIVGGATMFNMQGSLGSIGERNVEDVRKVLQVMRVPVIAEDTGGNYGRTVVMDAATGKLTIQTAGRGDRIL